MGRDAPHRLPLQTAHPGRRVQRTPLSCRFPLPPPSPSSPSRTAHSCSFLTTTSHVAAHYETPVNHLVSTKFPNLILTECHVPHVFTISLRPSIFNYFNTNKVNA